MYLQTGECLLLGGVWIVPKNLLNLHYYYKFYFFDEKSRRIKEHSQLRAARRRICWALIMRLGFQPFVSTHRHFNTLCFRHVLLYYPIFVSGFSHKILLVWVHAKLTELKKRTGWRLSIVSNGREDQGTSPSGELCFRTKSIFSTTPQGASTISWTLQKLVSASQGLRIQM